MLSAALLGLFFISVWWFLGTTTYLVYFKLIYGPLSFLRFKPRFKEFTAGKVTAMFPLVWGIGLSYGVYWCFSVLPKLITEWVTAPRTGE